MYAFPPHLSFRRATADDIPAVTELVRRSEEYDDGEPMVTIEDVISGWQQPGFDIDLDVLLVYEDSDLIAFAEVPGWRAEAKVSPEARGRGIGSALLHWMEDRAIERAGNSGEVRIGQTVKSSNEGAIALFVSHGYTVGHTSWVLELPADRAIDAGVPEGVQVRPFDGNEEQDVYRVIEDAFNEWPNRAPTTLASWRARVTERPGFDPNLLFVAVEDHAVVGAAFCITYPGEGWVQQMAVKASHRNRGIAKALLRTASSELRARGLSSVGLSTDSRTGALDLYLNVGMVQKATYVHYSKVLRPHA
jgi:mycothiol synthase